MGFHSTLPATSMSALLAFATAGSFPASVAHCRCEALNGRTVFVNMWHSKTVHFVSCRRGDCEHHAVTLRYSTQPKKSVAAFWTLHVSRVVAVLCGANPASATDHREAVNTRSTTV
jgi:hypothetical protein